MTQFQPFVMERMMSKWESVVPPEAAAIAFVRHHFDINATTLVQSIRDDKSVLIVPGDHFGFENHIRISYGLPHDYLTAGLDRIHEAIMEVVD